MAHSKVQGRGDESALGKGTVLFREGKGGIIGGYYRWGQSDKWV